MAASAVRRPDALTAWVSELPTQKTASNACRQAWRSSSSHGHTTARSATSLRAASTCVHSIIALLASEATTSKPRRARPTASWPVPAAQSSTRAAGARPSTTEANAATLPSGSSRASGTSQS